MKKPLQILLFSFIIHSSLFIANCYSQWVQQTLPQSGAPYDIVFFDANTGVIALNTTPPTLYRTTDSGFNWTFINYIRIFNFNKIDSQAIYGDGRNYNTDDLIYRSFNKGLTWDSVAVTPSAYTDISFINRDTGWVCGHDGSLGAIWKSTNGGITLSEELSSGTSGMDKIFFLPQKVNGEYIGWCSQSSIFRKTTNSGVNWFVGASISAGGKIYLLTKIQAGLQMEGCLKA